MTLPHIPMCFLCLLNGSLISEVCLLKIDTDSRKSTLTQKASNVVRAEPSASTPADILKVLLKRLPCHKVIYTVQDTTQLLCYKLSVDVSSVYNRI